MQVELPVMATEGPPRPPLLREEREREMDEGEDGEATRGPSDGKIDPTEGSPPPSPPSISLPPPSLSLSILLS